MTLISKVLSKQPDGGYESHLLATDVDQPLAEGWRAKCGRTIFRSRAMLAHPLLPARPCAECAAAEARQTPGSGRWRL